MIGVYPAHIWVVDLAVVNNTLTLSSSRATFAIHNRNVLRLNVESQNEQGFPQSKREMGSPEHSLRRSERVISVLYIEDNAAICDSTTMLLEFHGFSVFASVDRAGALTHLRQGVKPSILLTDYHLNGDKGDDVIKCVREMLAEDIPAIIITGDTTNLSTPESRPHATEIIQKPPAAGELASMIESLAV